MRAPVRAVAALAVAVSVAACSDSPAAPKPTTVDQLAAVADSAAAAGDPLASWIRSAASAVGRSPGAQNVTIVVDGVPQAFQAIVFESSFPMAPTSCGNSGSSCATPPLTIVDTRLMLAWDATMQHFVQVGVTSFEPSARASLDMSGTYVERGARGQPGKVFWGLATAPESRVSTGDPCPTRHDAASSLIASCVTAVYDFAFDFGGRPIDLSAGPRMFDDWSTKPAAHTLRMTTTRLPGAFVTFKPFTGTLPPLPGAPTLPILP